MGGDGGGGVCIRVLQGLQGWGGLNDVCVIAKLCH